jgi:hypothetical protein
MNELFCPAKIGRNDDYIWMVSVDEHLNHVETIGRKIGLKEDGLLAAKYHDEGKKDRLVYPIKNSRPGDAISFLKAYRSWIKKDIFDISTYLDSPFPEHAKRMNKDKLDISDYSYELIRHHHGFKIDEIVPIAHRFGKKFLDDLYLLIAADNICSVIYERALTETEFIIGDIREDMFLLHDFVIECKVVSGDLQKEVTLLSNDFNPVTLILDYHIVRREDLA